MGSLADINRARGARNKVLAKQKGKPSGDRSVEIKVSGIEPELNSVTAETIVNALRELGYNVDMRENGSKIWSSMSSPGSKTLAKITVTTEKKKS